MNKQIKDKLQFEDLLQWQQEVLLAYRKLTPERRQAVQDCIKRRDIESLLRFFLD